MRGYLLVGWTTLAFACGGGGDKKSVKKPKPTADKVEEVAKPETEEDRATKRRAEAHEIIPDGSTCLPLALKEDGAPRLQLGAIGVDAVVCAVDTNPERLLGPVGCWKVDLASGELAYKDPEPLPSRGFSVLLDGQCARGYCVPDEATVTAKVAHMAWDTDGKKVAVLIGDDVHLFDAASKDHESSFSIRGDKGVTNNPTAVHFVGSTIIVEGADDGANAAVWVFRTDGTQVGQVMSLGGKKEKPLSTYKGSLSILDKARIAVSERGMETLTTYDVENGKRAKLVRKAKRPACKPAELDAFWHDGDKVSDKCRGSIEALSGSLMGATAIAGKTNFLVLMRGERLGDLGVLDARSLAEKKSIKMPWCTEGEDDGAAKADDDDGSDKKAEKKSSTRGKSADPEEGGE